MGNKKLVWCCIIGILLGFIVPRVWSNLDSQTFLMIGMAGGLGVGYVLDLLDEKKDKEVGSINLGKKASEANKLMEKARADLRNTPSSYRENHDLSDPEETAEEISKDELKEDDPEIAEQAAKLSEAEDLLRKARERIK